MKHTQGPWKFEELKSKGNKDNFVVISNIDYICLIDAIEGFEKNKTNARLIAAAPDLLEACKEMLSVLEIIDFSGQDRAMDYDNLPFNNWEQAIKKAES